MFLSRLNEISGGFETIVSVSESFLSHLEFLRMIDFDRCVAFWSCYCLYISNIPHRYFLH